MENKESYVFDNMDLSNHKVEISIDGIPLFELENTKVSLDFSECYSLAYSKVDNNKYHALVNLGSTSGLKVYLNGKTIRRDTDVSVLTETLNIPNDISNKEKDFSKIVDTAKWIPCTDDTGYKYGYKCSVCKARIRNKDVDKHLFCHKCGRRMER